MRGQEIYNNGFGLNFEQLVLDFKVLMLILKLIRLQLRDVSYFERNLK